MTEITPVILDEDQEIIKEISNVRDDTWNMTDKQRAFCREYVVDWNVQRAAKAVGYTYATSMQMGPFVKSDKFQAYIRHLMEDAEKIAGVSKIRNAIEVAKIAYGENTEIYGADFTIKEFNELSPELKASISSVEKRSTKGGYIIKVTFHDKLKAIEMLNKMFGYNAPEKTEVGGPDGKPLQILGMIITNGVNNP